MRLLKVAIAGLVTAVAMFFSLLFAVGVAFIGVIAYCFLRLRGRPASVRFSSPHRPKPAAAADVIDVTATEVPADKLPAAPPKDFSRIT
jgi:hypothetical protein